LEPRTYWTSFQRFTDMKLNARFDETT
jgi:hypothetical protein